MADEDGSVLSALGVREGFRHVIYAAGDGSVLFDLAYPASSGRNFHELLRLLDSTALSAETGLHTPVNWIKGGDAVAPKGMEEGELEVLWGDDVRAVDLPSQMGYLKLVPDPQQK